MWGNFLYKPNQGKAFREFKVELMNIIKNTMMTLRSKYDSLDYKCGKEII